MCSRIYAIVNALYVRSYIARVLFYIVCDNSFRNAADDLLLPWNLISLLLVLSVMRHVWDYETFKHDNHSEIMNFIMQMNIRRSSEVSSAIK